MEDLIRCRQPFTSPTHHPQIKTQCQVFINSHRPYKFPIAFPKQHSIRLPSLSTHHLKPPHSLTSPRAQFTLFALGITTTNEGDTIATHDVIAGVEAFNTKQSAINTDIQDKEALTTFNAQLLLDTDAPCRDEDAPGITKMLAHASDLHHTNIQNAHGHNEFMHTQFEILKAQNEERTLKRKNQQLTYLFAALASSVGIVSLAGASVYCRFAWQMEGGEVPWTEMFGTFSLALGAAVGMEYWARWAHRTLWHASLWNMHESHHQPRDGPFELNDIFAIINAIPAILLMAFGFFHKGLVPGLCFGAGLGITVFGIAYMFVHDGLVHRRFPVGPIADVPYFQRVAAAHQLHHADKFTGVPYGLFLGPMELEEVGGRTELEKLLRKRKREKTSPING